MPAEPTSPPAPATIGRFEIRKVLGRGAQGVVYLAEDPKLLRLVAVKTLRGRSDLEDRLRHEARATARLRHPNVNALFELGEQGGRAVSGLPAPSRRTPRTATRAHGRCARRSTTSSRQNA